MRGVGSVEQWTGSQEGNPEGMKQWQGVMKKRHEL